VFEAMPNVLQPVQSPADVRMNVETFNSEAPRFYERAARRLRETTYWVYDPATEGFGPSRFLGFGGLSVDRYVRGLAGIQKARHSTALSHRRPFPRALGASYREDAARRARLEGWGVARFGPDAFGGTDPQKWRFDYRRHGTTTLFAALTVGSALLFARRQLLLPVVLPRFRMLPDCLIEFVPV
jgi:hypothetical protein